jgi:hypothetical protein
MLFRRALPAARHSSAHLVPIYEMGSKESNDRHDPLLINSLTAFNFRRPLEFPGELLSRYREFA